MGDLHRAPLASFVADLAAKFAIREFVETGTFMGDGCSFAAEIFPSVTTIEIDPEYHAMARQRHGSLPIRFLLGDSAMVLPEVVARLSGPSMFWLDGHAGGGNFGPEDCCPLLAELDAIARSPFPHYILVDDARASRRHRRFAPRSGRPLRRCWRLPDDPFVTTALSSPTH